MVNVLSYLSTSISILEHWGSRSTLPLFSPQNQLLNFIQGKSYQIIHLWMMLAKDEQFQGNYLSMRFIAFYFEYCTNPQPQNIFRVLILLGHLALLQKVYRIW